MPTGRTRRGPAKHHVIWIGTLALFGCASGGPDELIPLKTYFAPAEVQAPQISPDGSKISYIAPLDGVQNFFVAPVDDLDAAKPLTRFTDRGVQAGDVSRSRCWA